MIGYIILAIILIFAFIGLLSIDMDLIITLGVCCCLGIVILAIIGAFTTPDANTSYYILLTLVQ